MVLWPQIGYFCFYVLEKEMVKLSAQSPPKKEAIKVEEGLLRRSGPVVREKDRVKVMKI